MPLSYFKMSHIDSSNCQFIFICQQNDPKIFSSTFYRHNRDELQSTDQIIQVHIAMLYAVLHNEALLKTMELVTSLTNALE